MMIVIFSGKVLLKQGVEQFDPLSEQFDPKNAQCSRLIPCCFKTGNHNFCCIKGHSFILSSCHYKFPFKLHACFKMWYNSGKKYDFFKYMVCCYVLFWLQTWVRCSRASHSSCSEHIKMISDTVFCYSFFVTLAENCSAILGLTLAESK